MDDAEGMPAWFRWVNHTYQVQDDSKMWNFAIMHLVATTLTEIFYMGAGFGLYLNSRSHLEGWDIEVTFRGIAARLQDMTASALTLVTVSLTVLSFLSITPTASAVVPKYRPAKQRVVEAEPADTLTNSAVKDAVKEVKKSDDFKEHTEEYTVYDDVTKSSSSSSTGSSGLDWAWLSGASHVVGLICWGLLIAAVGAIIYFIIRATATMKALPSTEATDVAQARVVLGMDLSPEALPSDIPSAAAACWRAGDIRGALRILYAGSLQWMIEKARLPIQESDTEGDCLRHSTQLSEALQTQYFQGLTHHWMSLAYGHRLPDDSAMQQFIQQWPFRK
jgi:hypothetical protein